MSTAATRCVCIDEEVMKLLRFQDLVANGVVHSRMTLKRLIDRQGFPPGVLITPNARAWGVDEVNAWVASRPAARKAVRQKAGPSAASHGEAVG